MENEHAATVDGVDDDDSDGDPVVLGVCGDFIEGELFELLPLLEEVELELELEFGLEFVLESDFEFEFVFVFAFVFVFKLLGWRI